MSDAVIETAKFTWPPEYPPLTLEEREGLLTELGKFTLVEAGLNRQIRRISHRGVKGILKSVFRPIQSADDRYWKKRFENGLIHVAVNKEWMLGILTGHQSLDYFRDTADLGIPTTLVYDAFENSRLSQSDRVAREITEILPLLTSIPPKSLPESLTEG